MMEPPGETPPKNRRLFLYAGTAFIVAGGAAAIVLNQQKPRRGRPPRSLAPVILTGRVVSRVQEARLGELFVVLRPIRSAPPNRGAGITDRSGSFQLRGEYQGLADVFVRIRPSDPWTCRPVCNTTVPASKPIQLELIEGTSIRGRLVREGKPVTNAPVDLLPADQGSLLIDIMGADQATRLETTPDGKGGFSSRRDSPLPARQSRTDHQGLFVFHNLPEDAEFLAHSQFGKLPDDGVVAPRRVRTGADKTELDLGDVEVRPGRRLAGRVVFSDGKPPHGNLGAEVSQPYPASRIWSRLDQKGRFEFRGLYDGPVRVSIDFSNGSGRVRPGFRLSAKNKCLDPGEPFELAGQLDRDITDLTILFDEGGLPEPNRDPAVRAAFEKLSSGPITGIPAPSAREVAK
jgi:hypothetical protein